MSFLAVVQGEGTGKYRLLDEISSQEFNTWKKFRENMVNVCKPGHNPEN